MLTIRDHWREVLRFLYAHSTHGAATACLLYDGLSWRCGKRSVAVVLPHNRGLTNHVGSVLDAAEAFGAAVAVETMIETGPEDEGLEVELTERGYQTFYWLPVHSIPTNPGWRQRHLGPLPGGYYSELVTSDVHVAAFARLQDAAYAASYRYHVGCASSFFTHPSSLIGPDTVAAIVYDSHHLPVRCGQLIHAGGRVSGVSGAADPKVRGQHLGDEVWRRLLIEAARRWHVKEVLHETMPVAMPIAERHGLEVVEAYRRWLR